MQILEERMLPGRFEMAYGPATASSRVEPELDLVIGTNLVIDGEEGAGLPV